MLMHVSRPEPTIYRHRWVAVVACSLLCSFYTVAREVIKWRSHVGNPGKRVQRVHGNTF